MYRETENDLCPAFRNFESRTVRQSRAEREREEGSFIFLLARGLIQLDIHPSLRF